MDNGTSLLLVEDDRELAAMLTRLLGEEGYDVTHAADGQRGLHLGLTRPFAVLVIDRGLPAIEGLDLLTRLRSRGVTSPALVLSARGSTGDRVDGLDAGAEDYLTKPFDVEELLARLRALQRRHTVTSPVLPLGRRVLDIEARLVLDGTDADPASGIALSERECQLLEVLARRPRPCVLAVGAARAGVHRRRVGGGRRHLRPLLPPQARPRRHPDRARPRLPARVRVSAPGGAR